MRSIRNLLRLQSTAGPCATGLYRASYRGLYCPGCEDFFREKDVVEEGGCPDHGRVLQEVEEENVFFRLSSYQQEVAEAIRSGRLRIVPEARRTEVLRFLGRGLEDISISRDAARSGGWGIPFPGDPGQVVYVWIDALVNYLTGLGFPDDGAWCRFWGEGSRRMHVIGKNVWKFHAVDAVRYFLLRHVRPFDDSDFSEARLAGAYESGLANGLGNLLSRLTALCERFDVAAPPLAAARPPADLHTQLASYRFDRALDALWSEVERINREIAEARPWERSPEKAASTPSDLSRWVVELRGIAYWLSPFLPETAARVERCVRGPRILKSPALFPRQG